MIPVYDIDAMLIEVELALDWYAPGGRAGRAFLGSADAVSRPVA